MTMTKGAEFAFSSELKRAMLAEFCRRRRDFSPDKVQLFLDRCERSICSWLATWGHYFHDSKYAQFERAPAALDRVRLAAVELHAALLSLDTRSRFVLYRHLLDGEYPATPDELDRGASDDLGRVLDIGDAACAAHGWSDGPFPKRSAAALCDAMSFDYLLVFGELPSYNFDGVFMHFCAEVTSNAMPEGVSVSISQQMVKRSRIRHSVSPVDFS